jgi:hypothetical protein
VIRRVLVTITIAMAAVSCAAAFSAPADAIPHRTACLQLALPRARVHAAAVRRESKLDTLVAALQARHDPWGLNGGQIGALQAARSGISALDTHVQSACYATRSAFRSDAAPLFTTYRVFWLRVPQTRGIEAADRLGEARVILGRVADRVSAHVGTNALAAADLAAMRTALTVADSRLGTAPKPSSDIAALAALAPAADMTADDAAMETARADLFAARTSLVSARSDGLKVIADLGG